MRKPAFCICKNKDTDQLRGNREADQRLCFRYTDSTIPILPKSEIQNFNALTILYGCTAWFVSDLVKKPENRVSHNEAHLNVSFSGFGKRELVSLLSITRIFVVSVRRSSSSSVCLGKSASFQMYHHRLFSLLSTDKINPH